MRKGQKHSAETRKRQSESLKRYYATHKSKPVTEETRKKMSDAKKQWFQDHPEAGDKVSAGLKRYYKEHPEAREQMSKRQKQYLCEHPERNAEHSQLMKARFANPAARQAVSERMRQWHKDHPEETKRQSERMQQWHKDHPGDLRARMLYARQARGPLSEASRKKLSESQKRYFQEHPGEVSRRQASAEHRAKMSRAVSESFRLHGRKPVSDADRKKRSVRQKQYLAEHPEAVKQTTEKLRKHYANPVNRKRQSDATKAWNRAHPEEHAAHMEKASRRNKAHNSRIERAILAMLKELKFSFKREKRLKFLSAPASKHPFDFVLERHRIVIEADGDYWHANSEYYPEAIKRNCIRTRVARDKVETAAVHAAGWIMLRFWEHDIKQRPEWVKQVISEMVKTAQARDAIERDAAMRTSLQAIGA